MFAVSLQDTQIGFQWPGIYWRLNIFFLPGTLIAVDGRTANARFLKANFQRSWRYQYFKNFDQHFFELDESPLGVWNSRQMNFTSSKDK
jgi:hypothetical protein